MGIIILRPPAHKKKKEGTTTERLEIGRPKIFEGL
jgi:hypothetical protein